MHPQRVITCILPAGQGTEILARLRKIGIDSCLVHHARGVGESGRRRRGAAYYSEREIITVLVEPGRADEVFAFLYHETGIDKPHAGMIFMEKSSHGVPVVLPDIAEER